MIDGEDFDDEEFGEDIADTDDTDDTDGYEPFVDWVPGNNDEALRKDCLYYVVAFTAAPYAEHISLAADFEDFIKNGKTPLKVVP